ncbi:MAG: caspase family protein [Bacteroidetes bacterium]|nr:caspase family protein [Bacteroidota bacterium]MBS1540729.1 caspase family protein [Bacteroidota bacterium]
MKFNIFLQCLLLGLSLVTCRSTSAQDIYLSPLNKFSSGTKKIVSLTFSPDGRWLAAADEKNNVSVRKTDEPNTVVKQLIFSGGLVFQSFFELGKKYLALDKSGKLFVYDTDGFKETVSTPFQSAIKEACLDPSSQYLTAFSKDNQLEIFDLKANMTFARVPAQGEIKNAAFLGYDRFGQQLALISNLGDAYAWNPLNQKFLRQLKLKSGEFANSSSVIHSAGANSGGDRFLIGMQEVFLPRGGFTAPTNRLERRNWLLAYDWATGQEAKRIATRYRIDGMAFGPGPNHVAYYSEDSHTINMLNLDKVETTSSVSVDEKPTAISLSGGSQYLSVGTSVGNVYLYEVVRNNPADIKITKPGLNRNYGEQVVKESSIKIEGEIEGNEKIAKVFVNGEAAEFDMVKTFSSQVNLTKGKNRIRVAMQNTQNIITEKDFYVTSEPATEAQKNAASNTAGKRMALVIGNANYAYGNKLINTVNDASAMTKTLKELGFEVISILDGDYEKIKNAVYAFGDRIQDVDISIFYYAGHGLEVDGTNYLIPVDANIQSALDVKQKAIPVTGVIRTMEFSNNEGLNMIILDACRNNPFPTGKRGGSGLARVQAPSGTLIAYATDPGSTASDGEGANGLYTGELVKQLGVSQRIEDIFMNTRNAVEKKSNGSQRPWEEARLKGVFYLK